MCRLQLSLAQEISAVNVCAPLRIVKKIVVGVQLTGMR
jgi:hypothetical protein